MLLRVFDKYYKDEEEITKERYDDLCEQIRNDINIESTNNDNITCNDS